MKTYYIFGEEIVNEYNDEGIEGVIKNLPELGFGIFKFVEGKTKSIHLALAMDGWMEFTTIKKKEYNKIIKAMSIK